MVGEHRTTSPDSFYSRRGNPSPLTPRQRRVNELRDDKRVGKDSGRTSQSPLRALLRAVTFATKYDCERKKKVFNLI